MRFEVLGSLRATHDGREVTPPGRVQRLLLAGLLLHANRPVSTDVLVEAIWPGDGSGRTQAKLQVAVHRLRARLDEPSRLARETTGYRLRVAEDEYDVAEFNALAARLLMHDLPPEEAGATAQDALALWRGPAFTDVVEIQAMPEVSLWEERHRWVFEAWCEAEIALGRAAALVGELAARTAAEPLYERFAVLLMRALRASGRTADALAAYDRARDALRDELGVDPGPELQEEQLRVLSADSPEESEASGPPLPAQLPPVVELVGRNEELRRVGDPERLRLCVIAGTAGVGKTAVALAWAHRHAAAYPDGQIFIDLRGFSEDPPLDPATAAEIGLRALGVGPHLIPSGEDERSALLRSHLVSRRVLLVLDNARSSEQVRPLLPGSESCTALVTSRDVLPGLVAREGAEVVPLHPLTQGAAGELLESMIGARAAAEPEAIRDLACLCGDLPLALRVAAQQVMVRTDQLIGELVEEVIDGRDRLDLLDAGEGPSTDLRAVLSWSYESLGTAPARAFRMLGLLPGEDADLCALAALFGLAQRHTRRLLDALVRAHLVERTTDGRYRQHDLLRAYAADGAHRLDSSAVRAVARSRLLRFYASSALEAEAVSYPSRRQPTRERVGRRVDSMRFTDVAPAQEWIHREIRNLLASVELAEDSDSEAVFDLCHGLNEYLRDNGYSAEGLRVEQRALSLARAVQAPLEESRAMMGVGNHKAARGDFEDAENLYRSAAEVAEAAGHRARSAGAIGNMAILKLARGNLRQAEESLREVVATLRDTSTPDAVLVGMGSLGSCALQAGDPEGAQGWFEEALRLAEGEAPKSRAEHIVGLADAAIALGDPQRSESLAAEAERLAGGVHQSVIETAAHAARGRACVGLGRSLEGRALLQEALARARANGDVEERIKVLIRYAAASRGEIDAVPAHHAAAEFAQAHGMGGHEAGLRRNLAEVLLGEDDPVGAARELAQAAELYAELEDPRATEVTARLRAVEKIPATTRTTRCEAGTH